jgi:hypothetical protein
MSRKVVSTAWVALIVLGSILGGGRLLCAGADLGAEGGVDAKAAFARLKTLAGTWTGHVVHDHKDAKKQEHLERHEATTVTYRLTGAGSALIETQFPGTGHEMVSVYHLDGDQLRMTHYCAMGNQPRVRLDRAHSRPDHFIFVFDGGSNLNPAKDMHIHGLEITFHKDGQVTSAWEGYMGGKKAATTAFVMTRQ